MCRCGGDHAKETCWYDSVLGCGNGDFQNRRDVIENGTWCLQFYVHFSKDEGPFMLQRIIQEQYCTDSVGQCYIEALRPHNATYTGIMITLIDA